jgi:Uncharacterized protein conserved in bacteria (DUF2169)
MRSEGEVPLLGTTVSEREPGEFDETDIIPFKQRTDLILMTKAWGRGQRSIEACIRVGALDVRYRVQGERRVIYRGRGSWAFSEPEPFESIEMRYENAYGGFDTTLADPPIRHLIDLLDVHPGEYPRNPIGKGYVVRENPERLDGLLLPNLEHPAHRLTPNNLIVGAPEFWWRQPLPWSCNWFPKHCYPRVVHYRGIPAGLPDNDADVPEVRLGWLEPGHARRVREARHSDPLDGRFADAASPALITPLLRGIIVVVGATVLIARWGAKAGQDAAEGNSLRGILLTGGFRAIAGRMGLEDPWPGRRADDVSATTPGVTLGYPALRGTYRNWRISVTVCGFTVGGDGYDDGYFRLVVRGRRDSPWSKLGRLDRGKPPAEQLSVPAILALERLKERKKRGHEIVSIRVDAQELSCVTRDEITRAISLEEARTDTALPEPTELEAMLDDLVTLADGLPVVDASGNRARSADARGPR